MNSHGELYRAHGLLRLMHSDGGLYGAYMMLRFMYKDEELYRSIGNVCYFSN